jgi:malonyl-CoA/methylmalonyl-CoA synthetase
VFKGYWQMPEKTAEDFTADGWFRTGDMATSAPDGRVTLVGRAKDLVISGGFNVYPKEIEEVMDAFPGIVETAVIGVPHPDFGEAVVAVVVPEKGANIDLDALHAYLQDKLARFKQPKHVAVVDELPRNVMGKVQKNLLRAAYGGLFSGKGAAQ